MEYKINDKKYNVIIEKKNNKNTYIRVKDDLNIYVYTNYFVSKRQIINILDNNINEIQKMINKVNETKNNENEFYYLGKKYNIILMKVNQVELINDNIYTTDLKMLEKWLKDEIINIYKNRLEVIYNLFEENIPYPNLKIRKMKSRWGVCNRKNNNVTLNSDLIKFEIEKLDYVIVHELSHFVHFDHSKAFWSVVEKYCHDYKRIRKELRS